MKTPLEALKHHVTGAIERGEKVAITEQRPAQHTPGPWNVNQGIDGAVIDSGVTIATIPIDAHAWAANARLIAAAPELLEALEELNFRAHIASGLEIGGGQRLPGKLGDAMIAAGLAIRKATGEA